MSKASFLLGSSSLILHAMSLDLAVCQEGVPQNFQREELVAWCVVPFDAKKRGPEERAKMLVQLGIKRCAYDWRSEHVAEFEEEIRQYQKHGIEFFAFWKGHEEAFALFEKHGIRPQIWHTLRSPKSGSSEEKVRVATEAMVPLARRCQEAGCSLGLYNHGGWGGEPANMVAVCENLREKGFEKVGIVYNWHHGHDRMAQWKEDLALLQPYLLCLNLNGMNKGADPKILMLGQGQHEASMVSDLLNHGYAGPIGILDHQKEVDAKVALQGNLDGLETLLRDPGKTSE